MAKKEPTSLLEKVKVKSVILNLGKRIPLSKITTMNVHCEHPKRFPSAALFFQSLNNKLYSKLKSHFCLVLNRIHYIRS